MDHSTPPPRTNYRTSSASDILASSGVVIVVSIVAVRGRLREPLAEVDGATLPGGVTYKIQKLENQSINDSNNHS